MASVDQNMPRKRVGGIQDLRWLVRPWRGAQRDTGAQALKTMRCREQGPREPLRVVLEAGAAFR